MGTLEIKHYDNGDVVLNSDFEPTMEITAFAYYVDKLVYNAGPLGSQLYKSVQDLAGQAWKCLQESEDLESVLFEPNFDLDRRVVPASESEVILSVNAILSKKGENIFIETGFKPLTCPNTERVVQTGCEALFVHLFQTQKGDNKFFMPFILLKQCEWYDTNGLPSVSQVSAAAVTAILTAQELASQRQ